jgi:hypothetical protein
MAFVTIVRRATAVSSTTNSTSWSGMTWTWTTNTAIASGDRVLWIAVVSSDGVPTLSENGGLGWSKQGQTSDGASAVTGAIFTLETTGAYAASAVPAFALSSSASEQYSATLYAIKADTGNALNLLLSTAASGSSTNSDPPAVTNSSGSSIDACVIATRHGDSTVQATGAPGAFVNLLTATAGGTNGASTASAENNANTFANGGAINPAPFTSATEQWVSYTLAVYQTVSAQTFNQSVNATTTPVAAAARSSATTKSIISTPVGSVLRALTKTRAISSTPVGSVLASKAVGKAVSAVSTPVGSVRRAIAKLFATTVGGGSSSTVTPVTFNPGVLVNTGTCYAAPVSGAAWSSSLASAQMPMPVSGVISDFYVYGTAGPGGSGEEWDFSLNINGSAVGPNVALVENIFTRVSDSSNPVSVSAGDLICIQADPVNTPTNATVKIGFTVTTADGSIPMFAVLTAGATMPAYMQPDAARGAGSITAMEVIIPSVAGGSLTAIYANLESAPGASTSRTFTVYSNGVSQSLAATVANTSTASSGTGSVSYAQGDRLAVGVTASGTPAFSACLVSLKWQPTTFAEVPLFATWNQGAVSAGTIYTGVSAYTRLDKETVESTAYGVIPTSLSVTGMYATVDTSPGTAKSRAFKLRKGTLPATPSDQAATVTISGSSVVGSYSGSVSVTAGDVLDVSETPSGTPASVNGMTVSLTAVATASTQGSGGPLPSFSKTFGSGVVAKTISAVTTPLATVRRALAKVAYAIASTPVPSVIRRAGKALSIVTTPTFLVVKSIAHAVSIAATPVATVARALTKTAYSIVTTAVPVLLRQSRRTVAIVSTGVATIVVSKAYLKTLSIISTSVPLLVRRLTKIMLIASTPVGVVNRALSKVYAITTTSVASAVRRLTRTISVSSTPVAVVVRSIIKTFNIVTTPVFVVARSMVKILAIVATPLAMLSASRLFMKVITAMRGGGGTSTTTPNSIVSSSGASGATTSNLGVQD